jgi:hypothetical protein
MRAPGGGWQRNGRAEGASGAPGTAGGPPSPGAWAKRPRPAQTHAPVMRPGEELVTKRIASAATSIVTTLLRRLVTGSVKAMSPELGALGAAGGGGSKQSPGGGDGWGLP